MLPPRTQGDFSLLVQEKATKKKDTPDGATFRCASCSAKSPGRTIPVRPFAGTTVHLTVVFIRLTPLHPRFRDPALILRGVPAVPGAALLPWGHPSRAIRGAALGGAADTKKVSRYLPHPPPPGGAASFVS